VGLYKLCRHKQRDRDRCEHLWWGSFRGVRVSLARWTNADLHSKAEAYAALDELRRAVRKGTFNPRGLETPARVTTLTFREFAEVYVERHVTAKKLSRAGSVNWRLRPLVERFGDAALADIKTGDIEDFIAALRKPRMLYGREHVLSAASVNRTIEILRHMLNWAVGREYLEKTPFRRGTETIIKKLREDNMRRRRLSEEEEARILTYAPTHLRSAMITALDTGMRRGEMLALRFADIDFENGLITLRGETTKSRKTRLVPISTARLRALLEWLRIDATGEKKADHALVFSNEVGEPLGSFRTAWVTAVLKAHDITPEWKAYGWTALTPACREQFRRINLHWHDLRHEYASRLVERGVPLAQVRDLLGHASITTTERYDNQTLANLQIAAAKLERGRVFELPAALPVSDAKPSSDKRNKQPSHAGFTSTNFQHSFKMRRKSSRSTDPVDEREQDLSASEEKDLQNWLGGRDSNPDNVVQSHVSYR
jgi:integrase